MSTVTHVLQSTDQRRRHHDFWRQRLTRIEQPFQFKCVRQQQFDHQSPKRLHFHFTLSQKGTEVLDGLSAKQKQSDRDLTSFVVLLAALEQVLGIYARQTCIIVDTPGFRFRPAGGHVSIIEQLHPYLTIGDFLNQVRQTLDESYRYQDFNREEVADHEFHLPHTTSPILLTYSQIHHSPKTTDYPMAIFLEREQNTYRWSIEADSRQFDAAFLEDFCRHWQHVLEQFSDTQQVCGNLQLLSENQQKRMLHFYGPINHAPPPQTLVNQWESICREMAEQPALFADGRLLSYAHVNGRANFLAATLWSEHGINHGHRVAWYADRSVESAITLLAILKAGAIACPINASNGLDRKHLAQLKAQLVIVPQHSPQLPDGPCLVLEELQWRQDVTDLPILAKPDDEAMILYSQSSLAFIPLTHAMLANSSCIQAAGFSLNQKDRVLLVEDPATDFGIIELWTTWAAGASAVSFDPLLLENEARLRSYLEATGVTIAAFAPEHLAKLSPETLAYLRIIMTKGQAMLSELASRFAQSHHFFNVYGATETGGWMSFYHIHPEDACGDHLPVGKALGDFSVYILSDQLQLLPPGLIGEICISGSAVAQGYLEGEGDNGKIVADPFRPGQRMFRTGDLGYRQEDGNLVYLGSAKQHVRVQGYRIHADQPNE